MAHHAKKEGGWQGSVYEIVWPDCGPICPRSLWQADFLYKEVSIGDARFNVNLDI